MQTDNFNAVDPQEWLAFVLAKLPDHPVPAGLARDSQARLIRSAYLCRRTTCCVSSVQSVSTTRSSGNRSWCGKLSRTEELLCIQTMVLTLASSLGMKGLEV